MTECPLYVLTRSDLSPGQQAVQAMHALADFAGDHPQHFHPWNRGSNTLILLSVADEDHLLNIKVILYFLGFAHSMFREPDMGFQATALAIEPHPIFSDWLRDLPLALAPKRKWWQRG